MKLRNFRDNDEAVLGVLLPIGASIFITVLVMIYSKIGPVFFGSNFIFHPIFSVWVITMGFVVAGLVWAKQIFVLLAIVGGSFAGLIFYYLAYVI